MFSLPYHFSLAYYGLREKVDVMAGLLMILVEQIIYFNEVDVWPFLFEVRMTFLIAFFNCLVFLESLDIVVVTGYILSVFLFKWLSEKVGE